MEENKRSPPTSAQRWKGLFRSKAAASLPPAKAENPPRSFNARFVTVRTTFASDSSLELVLFIVFVIILLQLFNPPHPLAGKFHSMIESKLELINNKDNALI